MTIAYGREIPVHEKINKIGKLEWVKHLELLINPSDEVLQEANYRKHVRYKCVYSGNNIRVPELKKLLCNTYGVNYDDIDILYYDTDM